MKIYNKFLLVVFVVFLFMIIFIVVWVEEVECVDEECIEEIIVVGWSVFYVNNVMSDDMFK